jgi:hypothetical protein
MAIKPNPDTNQNLMQADFGTRYLITDPRSERYLREAHINHLKESKRIIDAWTI